jgi:hypothetical protein
VLALDTIMAAFNGPFAQNITREEIRLTIQLHIVSMFRRHFLREELDKTLSLECMALPMTMETLTTA